MFGSRSLKPVLGVLALALALGACGRSAPEGEVALGGDGAENGQAGDPATEPSMAGIQVISENPVVATVPTTAPPATPAPTPAPAPTAATTHVVQPGDTLSAIAERYGVSIDAISQANGIENANDIQLGQELIIPATG